MWASSGGQSLGKPTTELAWACLQGSCYWFYVEMSFMCLWHCCYCKISYYNTSSSLIKEKCPPLQYWHFIKMLCTRLFAFSPCMYPRFTLCITIVMGSYTVACALHLHCLQLLNNHPVGRVPSERASRTNDVIVLGARWNVHARPCRSRTDEAKSAAAVQAKQPHVWDLCLGKDIQLIVEKRRIVLLLPAATWTYEQNMWW